MAACANQIICTRIFPRLVTIYYQIYIILSNKIVCLDFIT
nr:MAG TPA: hypothetical protein [Caudoviricetes sp.]